jgi:hypothetical protein
LQQLVCGYLPKDDDGEIVTISNERLEVLDDVISQRSGQIIVWCRFTEDIMRISERYKDDCVVYYGGNKQQKGKGGGEEAKQLFVAGKKRLFIGNAAAGGAGLNLQGGKRSTVIYYSNSFRSLDRWQSEDRNHRKGTEEEVTYIDLVARGSVDRGVLANLRGKRDISRLSLDEIRQLIRFGN